jgi:DNA-binding NarL/FixJ family response regulator
LRVNCRTENGKAAEVIVDSGGQHPSTLITMATHGRSGAQRWLLSGYLLKDAAFEELSIAIQAILKGQIYLSPAITGVVVRQSLGWLGRKPRSPQAKLSKREQEVLQLIAEGKSTKEIAVTLYVSVKTVETHRKQIMDKLDIYSVAGLTKYAVREGLTSLHK